MIEEGQSGEGLDEGVWHAMSTEWRDGGPEDVSREDGGRREPMGCGATIGIQETCQQRNHDHAQS
jgi:hypothetical protein